MGVYVALGYVAHLLWVCYLTSESVASLPPPQLEDMTRRISITSYMMGIVFAAFLIAVDWGIGATLLGIETALSSE